MENRRKTIVINKKFQHHYALLFVACTIILTNLFIVLRAVFPGAQPFDFTLELALAVGLVELILLSGVWYITLRLTHRIAGPVYVFTRDLEKFADGNYSTRIKLRENDMFQEEAEILNACLDKLESRLTIYSEEGDK